MSAPLTIRFATDHSAAKAGMQDLAASVVSSMVKVSSALNTGIQANGGYVNSARVLATSAINDFGHIGAAGLEAAHNSNNSVVAISAAMLRAAHESNTGAMATKASLAVASESAKFHFDVIRREAAATVKLIASSPLIVGTASAIAGLLAVKLAYDFLAASARAASEALEATGKVGDDATKLGVSTTFLQTYRAQARDLKVEVNDLNKSLEMAKAAFTVNQGDGGTGARNDSAFGARLRQQAGAGNVSKDQVANFDAAVGTEAKFRAALQIMEDLQARGRELAALDLGAKIFPPEVLDRIRSGAIEISRFRKTMDDIKNPDLVLLSPEEIVRAQELQRRLEAAQATLDKASRDFKHELALAGEGLKEDAIAWSELMAKGATFAVGLLKQARQYAEQVEASRPATYGVDYADEKDKPASGLARDVGKPKSLPSTGDADMDNALNKLRGNLGNRTLVDQAQAASRSMTDGVGAFKDKTAPIVAKGHKSSSDSFDAVETYINGLEKTAAAAKAEADAFGKSNAEKAAAIALAKLKETADQQGIAVTDEQTAKVKSAAEATSKYRDKIADLEQAQNHAAETARYFGNAISDSFADAILEGKGLTNILLDLEKTMARAALKALITGEGPLASFLGTAPAASAGSSAVGGVTGMFASMFRANGGPVQAGQAYTVGEMGQEIFVPNQDGRMVPIARGGGFGGGGAAGGVQIYDQRTMSAAAPEVRQGSNGSTQIVLRDAEGALYQRASRGQGPFAGAIGGAAGRRG